MDFLPVTASNPDTSAQGLLLDRWLQQLRVVQSSARSSSERRQQQQQHQGGGFSLFEIPTQLYKYYVDLILLIFLTKTASRCHHRWMQCRRRGYSGASV